jgi:hypothetical protein
VAEGRAAQAPFVVLAGVAGLVWMFIAVVSAVVVLIWWLF